MKSKGLASVLRTLMLQYSKGKDGWQGPNRGAGSGRRVGVWVSGAECACWPLRRGFRRWASYCGVPTPAFFKGVLEAAPGVQLPARQLHGVGHLKLGGPAGGGGASTHSMCSAAARRGQHAQRSGPGRRCVPLGNSAAAAQLLKPVAICMLPADHSHGYCLSTVSNCTISLPSPRPQLPTTQPKQEPPPPPTPTHKH